MSEATFTWEMSALESHGNLYLEWRSDAPFDPEKGQITVYKNQEFPHDPRDEVKASISDTSHKDPWDTGLPWGSDWYCAHIAKGPSGDFVYINQLITTGGSKPDSKTSE